MSAVGETAAAEEDFGLREHQRLGLILMGVLVAVVFGWGLIAQIASAVIAPGRVAVESSVKQVQHREGGTVMDLLVRDGDFVTAGQVLLRLDATVASANAANANSQMLELTARRLRLEAERDGRGTITPPADAPAGLGPVLAAEIRLMQTRQQARSQAKAQLREQIGQMGDAITGLNAQIASEASQATLIQGELKGIRDLYAQGLAPLARVNALEREAERLEGERGQLVSDVARTRTRISEINLQILKVDSDWLAEVMNDLKDTNLRLSQVGQEQTADNDLLRRVEIRAPASGRVQQMIVHTRGGVISPGETLMIIVPDRDRLVVEARIDPRHIDQVRMGDVARIRFTSFSGATTPELVGRVDSVSSDAQTDEHTGVSYYVARCVLAATGVPAAFRARLIPGMPAEVHIQTGSRNALSYFVKPITDQLERTFREE